MSANSSIQWTDKTWNPVRGCSVVSPGCVNCYAMKQAHRFSGGPKVDGGQVVIREAYHRLTKQTSAGPQWTGKVATIESSLLEPLSWRKPQHVFVNSMSDLFHEDVPFEFIDKVFAVMALARQHTFQILTKRATRMYQYMTNRALSADYWKRAVPTGYALEWQGLSLVPFPLPNVWLGVSVENQHFADERIPLLLQAPAAVRFISAEPLLGQVDLTRVFVGEGVTGWGRRTRHVNALDGWESDTPAGASRAREHAATGKRLDWIIVGGESGPGARPFDLAWARSIVQQCKAAGVPVFVKQAGSNAFHVGTKNMAAGAWVPLRLKDRKGGDIAEWPADLRVREFPEVGRSGGERGTTGERG